MRWLLFLSRLAFICGFCFLVSFSLLIKEWMADGELAKTMITIGTFMGIIIVPITLLCYLIVILLRKKLTAIVPLWLVICNVVWLFVYLLYMLFQNGRDNYSA